MGERHAILGLVRSELNKGRHPRLLIDLEWAENEPAIRVVVYRENTEEFPEEQRAALFTWLGEALGRADKIHPVWLDVRDYVPNI